MTNGSIVAPQQRSVLISGIGVAGPALAYWLTLYGFKTTLVEKPEHLRTGGYVIDFWSRGSAADFAGSFTPKTRLGLFLRNQVTKMFRFPFIAEFAMGASLSDRVDLPDYPYQAVWTCDALRSTPNRVI